jgi:Glycine cleavage system protein P (pyridoxal-binding), N-terminal domain
LGGEALFDAPVFHEQALRLPAPAARVLSALAADDILGGFDLGAEYPALDPAVLVCATEMRTDEDMMAFRDKLALALRHA